MFDIIKKLIMMEKLRFVDNFFRVFFKDIDVVFIRLFLKWVFYLKFIINLNCSFKLLKFC